AGKTLYSMKTTTLMTVLCAVVLSPAQAGDIGVDPTSGSTGLVSGFGGLTLGWEFEVTAADGIVVDGLGFWDHQSDGFLFGQTFPVGLWDASTGTLLRDSVITSASALKPSLDPDGRWRVNSVAPTHPSAALRDALQSCAILVLAASLRCNPRPARSTACLSALSSPNCASAWPSCPVLPCFPPILQPGPVPRLRWLRPATRRQP